ncbi:MAG: hypothetical protein ABI766_03285 [Gemmatimonadales bacterium]
MNSGILAGSLLTGLVLTAPLSAQQISAHVVVRGGPAAGHVVVANGYSTYRRPVVVDRYAPRVIVVQRVAAHRRGAYLARHGYRPVTLYYVNGRYYDRYVRGHGVREVVVYERNGRYYDARD